MENYIIQLIIHSSIFKLWNTANTVNYMLSEWVFREMLTNSDYLWLAWSYI